MDWAWLLFMNLGFSLLDLGEPQFFRTLQNATFEVCYREKNETQPVEAGS